MPGLALRRHRVAPQARRLCRCPIGTAHGPFSAQQARGLIERSPLPFQSIRRVGATTSLNLLMSLTRELIWGAINITLPPDSSN